MKIKNHFMYLLTIMCIGGFYRSVNATPIRVTCDKWEVNWEMVYKSYVVNSGCYPVKYTSGGKEYVDVMCPFGTKCISWSISIDYRALYKEMLDMVGRSSLYSDVVYGIDQNSTDFRDRVIKMLDTVTLQKIYDPNLVNQN